MLTRPKAPSPRIMSLPVAGSLRYSMALSSMCHSSEVTVGSEPGDHTAWTQTLQHPVTGAKVDLGFRV